MGYLKGKLVHKTQIRNGWFIWWCY